MSDAVLDAEQAHLERALRCLAQMRADASAGVDAGIDGTASQSLARMRAQRLASLGADGQAPPFFGRFDRQADGAPTVGAVEVFHLGRRHVRDRAGNPMVIDWRAPIARHFYQASAADPQGVRLRRRFGFQDGQVSSYEDEQLSQGEYLGAASELLLAEIERPRVGPMRDIVATIQPDQDDLVRAELDRSLCVQGAPGTGKTAVGLHRAAYLLYSYPARLRRSGVLIVGPNTAFLHYIGQVLPTLGEGGITQTTVAELTGRAKVRRSDELPAAVLKGDARMAEVLRNAVESLIGRPDDDLVVLIGHRRYRIPRERLRRYLDAARRDDARWSVIRDRLRHQLAADVRRQREDAGSAPSDAETDRIAKSASVRGFVDLVWPAFVPHSLLIRLYTDPDFRKRCALDILTESEQQLLAWPEPPRSIRAAAFSEPDLALLDELTALAQPGDTYVHLVLDEAQDLSAMQCRAVGRRCPTGSITVLGDLAQATTPWAPRSWAETLQHLGHPDAEVRPLVAGYRVPMPILSLANRLLPHIAVGVPPATSIRPGHDALAFGRPDELPDVLGRLLELPGSIAVITTDLAVGRALSDITAAGLDAAVFGTRDGCRIEVVPASTAKGLEFDMVVLLEPAELVSGAFDRVDGLRLLYVCLTRAVSHLAVLHAEPLPAELD